MVWFVVNFISDDTVEVVPESWYITASKECFWPPAKTPRHKIRDAQKEKQLPGTDWQPYPAIIMGKYDSFALADLKASKAKYTDVLSSMEECGKGKRSKKRNSKYFNHREEISSSESTISSDDNTDYPLEPKKRKTSRNSSFQPESTEFATPKRNKETNIDTSRHTLEATNTGSELSVGSRINTPTLPTPTCSIGDTKCDEDFKRTVLKQLYIIVMKLNDMSDLVIKKINDGSLINTAEETGRNYELLNNISNQFPLNHENLLNLENKISTDNELRRLLVNHFKATGGLTVKDITRRLLYKIFSNELGALFSWEGAKGKRPFKRLHIANVIIDAVRLNIPTKDATEHDIVSNIKAWLVRCPDRINKKDKKTQEENNK